MVKMILRLKIFHLSSRTLTLLFATLLITIGTQLASHADTSQLLLSEDGSQGSGQFSSETPRHTRRGIHPHSYPTFCRDPATVGRMSSTPR